MNIQEWFNKYAAKSFSPQINLVILDIAASIDEELSKGGDKEDCANEIIEYRNALIKVSIYAHIQQQEVINTFRRLIEKEGNEK